MACKATRNFVSPSNLNLEQLESGQNTTLRFLARKGTNKTIIPWLWEETRANYDRFYSAIMPKSAGTTTTLDHSHAVNIWLNIPHLQCTPSNPTPVIGEAVTFNVTGGNGTYSWSNTDGTPNTGSGTSLSSLFNSIGTKTINVSDTSGLSGVCTVNVDYAPLACTVTNDANNTVFTATGGNLLHSFFRFFEGTPPAETVLSGSLAGNTLTTTFTTPGTKIITAQRCDIAVLPTPPPSCVPITKKVSGLANSEVSITAPCDGTLSARTAEDKVLTKITKAEGGDAYVAICDDNGVTDWCGSTNGGGSCCTTPTGQSVGNRKALICNRDGSFIAIVPTQGTKNCPPNGAATHPIDVKAGDVVSMKQTGTGKTSNDTLSSITFTPLALPVASCEEATCPPVTQSLPQIQVTVDGGPRFGSQAKDTTVTKTVTITNVGDDGSILRVNDININPNPSSAFSFSTLNISSIQKGDSARFTVNFTPSEIRTYSANLNIVSNDNNPARGSGTLTIGLLGEGIEAPVVTLQSKKTGESDASYVNNLTVVKNTQVTLRATVTPTDSICTASNDTGNTIWNWPDRTLPSGNTDTPVGVIDKTTMFSLECSNPLKPTLSTSKTITVTVQGSGTGTNIRDL
jgi:hypothetical protein